ncbi:MAG: CPBP family intramembrane metalloprotease [Gammaproteobacteria bacterium]|nr:CPBP family intramembrane metalloprotease [Gammaproteobacteria bacterium]
MTKNIYKFIKVSLPTAKKLPSRKLFIIISTVQTLILISLAAAFGVAASNQTNLHAPFLEALVSGKIAWDALQPQILPSLVVGIAGAVIFLMVYYGVCRPRLDKKTIQCMESLRMSSGIWGRVLYGGIVEEVLSRWGLMMFFVWVGTFFGGPSPFILWAAIIISGLLFGLGHLPAYLSFGCKKTPAFMISMLGLNLWASIIFGWLFWHYGLCAAMIAHALFHLVWYPFDVYFAEK